MQDFWVRDKRMYYLQPSKWQEHQHVCFGSLWPQVPWECYRRPGWMLHVQTGFALQLRNICGTSCLRAGSKPACSFSWREAQGHSLQIGLSKQRSISCILDTLWKKDRDIQGPWWLLLPTLALYTDYTPDILLVLSYLISFNLHDNFESGTINITLI